MQNALVSEVTADVHKKSNLWQIVITVFFQTFGEKNTVINKLTEINCKLEELFLNNSLFTNLKVTNNHANATVILDIPDVNILQIILEAIIKIKNIHIHVY